LDDGHRPIDRNRDTGQYRHAGLLFGSIYFGIRRCFEIWFHRSAAAPSPEEPTFLIIFIAYQILLVLFYNSAFIARYR
jgi:hypothetical protein